MSLFEFVLKDLTDVMPWGEEGNRKLHWFGLTDGYYHMNVGKAQLFRYSEEILNYWKNEYPEHSFDKVYVDYQVIRLYEDLLEKIVDMLQPVPANLHKYVETYDKHRDWATTLYEIYESTDDEEVQDLYLDATDWWNYCRGLSSMHLNEGPNIWIWNFEDTIRIRWNNELCEIDGIQPWSSIKGEYSLPLNEFKNEVQSFHDRLMSQMLIRIQEIKGDNPIPHIKIDVETLEKEHEERKKSLIKALDVSPSVTNWEMVSEAINRVNKA